MQTPNADRFMIQLLLYRYEILLTQLKSSFTVTEEQEEALRRRIINTEWITSAFKENKSASAHE
jgi:hypothetical protein